MSSQEPTAPYVYQPLGSATHKGNAKVGRLYGVGFPYMGIDEQPIIRGLTKDEAEAVAALLTEMQDALRREGATQQ